MRPAAIYLLFFLSGIAGLIYQVIWVRQFGNIFGNTVHSAALVTAIFMLGLGLGSYLFGRWSDRRYAAAPESLLRVYALVEGGIALLGLAIALLLPRVAPLSALISSYVVDDVGLHVLSWPTQLFRHAVAVVLLMPATLLMGGTLTLLIRYLVRSELAVAGWRIGVLYGINTAGAALGAFLVDFALVPRFGLFATQALAVLLNLAVCLAALRLAGRSAAAPSHRAPPAAAAVPGGRSPLALWAGAALFLSGFAAMGMELLWFRLLSTALGAHRTIFSLLLVVILVGIWLGSTAGGAAHRRLGHPAELFILAQCAFVVSALALLFAVDLQQMRGAFFGAAGASSLWSSIGAALQPMLVVAGLPAFFMGLSFPLANATAQRAEARVGRRAGALYLANTFGAVAGSLVTGFALLPLLGSQRCVIVVAGCGLAAALPLYICRRLLPRGEDRLSLVVGAWSGAAAALALLALWLAQPPYFLAQRSYAPASRHERLIAFSEGVNEAILVTESSRLGTRRLYTNGHPMSGTTFAAQRYMRAFVHLPLLQLERPRRVLVICFGVGNTLHAASLHRSVERLEVVDLSRHVLEHAGYFARWNHHVLRDPRVAIYVNDGRQHLRMQPPERYDLITLEPPPIDFAGVAALYSKEFYRLARERLTPDGRLTQWLPIYQVSPAVAASMVRAFLDVFPGAALLSGHEAELILIGGKQRPPTFSPELLKRRLLARPRVLADLRAISLASPTELVGTFVAAAATLERVTAGMPPITDDFPAMEYGDVRRRPLIAEAMFDTSEVRAFCPRCFVGGAPHPLVRDLPAYLRLMQRLYRSYGFRTHTRRRRLSSAGLDVPRSELLRAYRRSDYLQRLYVPPR